MGNEDGNENTNTGVEIEVGEDGTPVIKYDGKEMTSSDLKRELEKGKNLESGYTQKFQEVAEEKRKFEAEKGYLLDFDKMLGDDPELEKEFLAMVEKKKSGGKKQTQSGSEDPALSEIRKELNEMKAERDSERAQKQQAEIASVWDARINKLIEEAGITDTTAKKLVYDSSWMEVVRRGDQIKDMDELKGIVAKAKSVFKSETIKKVRNEDVPIGGKGGGGGKTTPPDKTPLPRSEGRKDFIRGVLDKIKQNE